LTDQDGFLTAATERGAPGRINPLGQKVDPERVSEKALAHLCAQEAEATIVRSHTAVGLAS
jgi:hypothetical protein